MNIPKDYLEMIIDEFKVIEELCNNALSLGDKLYFFSASFGIVNRVMNFYCDPILISMHQALQSVHQGMSQRLALPKIPGIASNQLPNEMVEALFKYFFNLREALLSKDDNEVRKVIEKLNVLWYATGGNGYYLFLQKKLTL